MWWRWGIFVLKGYNMSWVKDQGNQGHGRGRCSRDVDHGRINTAHHNSEFSQPYTEPSPPCTDQKELLSIPSNKLFPISFSRNFPPNKGNEVRTVVARFATVKWLFRGEAVADFQFLSQIPKPVKKFSQLRGFFEVVIEIDLVNARPGEIFWRFSRYCRETSWGYYKIVKIV